MTDQASAAATDTPAESQVSRPVRRAIAVKPGELEALGWAWLYLFALVMSYYITRPIRDTMGIAKGTENLPPGRGGEGEAQDWGGPIGLGPRDAATRARPHPLHLQHLRLAGAGTKHIERFAKFASGPIGRFLIMRFNFMTRVAVPNVAMHHKLTKAERAGYAGPYPTPASRRPQTIFPKEILASRDYLADVEAGLAKLRDKPALILWGDSDEGFRDGELRRFQRLLPRAKTVLLEHARHFVQEDAPDKITAAIVAFEARPAGVAQ